MKKFLISTMLIIFCTLPVFSDGMTDFEPDDPQNTEVQTNIKNKTKPLTEVNQIKQQKASKLKNSKKENKKTSADEEDDDIELSAEEKSSNNGSTEMTNKKYNKNENPFDRGYAGKIPNIDDHFQMYKEEDAEPAFEVNEDFNDPYKVKPAPRDNPAFINIILKEDKVSQFINELNELVFIIEKIQQTLEDKASLQVFSARAYNLDKYVEFFREKYQNRPESSYASYKKLMALNSQVQALAALRREKEIYSPYVVSASNGNAFSDNNIDLQTEYLLENIRSTLVILKEAK